MNQPLKIRKGFALAAGLFSVTTLYFMATIVATNARHNFEFSRQSLEAAQAQLLAQAGTDYALDILNQGDGSIWEASHKAPNPPERRGDPLSSYYLIWTEDVGTDAFRVDIVVEAHVGGKVARKRTLVKKKPAVEPIKYAVLNGTSRRGMNSPPGEPFRLFKKQGSSFWTPLIEPWRSGDASLAWANELYQPAGDSHGNFYVLSRNPGFGYFPLFFTAATQTWTKLKQVPADVVNPGISDLAALPDVGVFCFAAYPSPTHMWYLPQPDPLQDWIQLPDLPSTVPAPTRTSPPPTTADGAWHLSQIACDGENVYVLQAESSQIYRLQMPSAPGGWSVVNTLTSADWEPLPVPRERTFKVLNSKLVGPTQPPGSPTVDWLMALSVDPGSGQVFAKGPAPPRTPGLPAPIETIYRYTPDKVTGVDGVWTADPLPAPGFRYLRGQGWINTDWDGANFPALKYYTVDHACNLSAVWSKPDINDTHYQCDLAQKRWVHQGPVSASAGGTLPDGSSGAILEDQTYGPDVTNIGGGGMQELGRTTSYVPLYSD